MKNVPPTSQEATKSMRHKRQELLTPVDPLCLCVCLEGEDSQEALCETAKNNNTKGKTECNVNKTQKHA